MAELFMSLVDWLNSNAGFVMAVLTCVYVIATIWISVESRRTNRLNLKAIDQSATFERARNRPYVIFSIDTEVQTFSENDFVPTYYISVKNIGVTSAYNITISTIPELKARLNGMKDDKVLVPTLTSKPMSVLHPSREEREFLAPTRFMFEDYKDNELLFHVAITYSDLTGKIYKEKFEINLASNKDRFHQANLEDKFKYQLMSSIEKGCDALEKLVKILGSPDRSNLFFPIDTSKISSQQIELLRRLVESNPDEAELFIARQFVGGEHILRLTDVSHTEIEGLCSDVETLCRAGLLNGYYSDGSLQFTVSSSAKSFLANKDS